MADTSSFYTKRATTGQRGVVELATQAEVTAGTDTERAVTPATLAGGAGMLGGDNTWTGTNIFQDAIYIETENMHVEDNYINLNTGYTSDTAVTCGIVMNVDPTTTTDTSTTGGFATTSTVTTTGSGTFSAGDIIHCPDADDVNNRGFFEVASHTGTTLTIDATPQEDWTQSAFVVDTADTDANFVKVTVRVLRAATSGDLETAYGATVPLTYTPLGGSLDDAYNQGSTVTVDTGSVNWNSSITSAAHVITHEAAGSNGALIDMRWDGTNFTGRPHAILIAFDGATSFNNASDIYGINLTGATNAGAGDLIALNIDSGFDKGIVNADTLEQSGAATFTGTVDCQDALTTEARIYGFRRVTGAGTTDTITAADHVIDIERTSGGTLAITLPPATGSGATYTIKRNSGDTQGVSLEGDSGSDTVDGAVTTALNAGDAYTVCDTLSGEWIII